MYIKPEFYKNNMKLATNCYIAKTVKNLEAVLDANEIEWFHNHPQFRHLFHMTRDVNHKTTGFYMLLIRTAKIVKKKEVWFILNGVPIRYSMNEHALISGLDCRTYPENYEERGNLKFVDKHFKKEKCTVAAVEKKFLSMKNYSRDRLKMAILYFLSSVIKGNGKRGKDAPVVDVFIRKVVTDPDYCTTFPWGRYTFLDNLQEIKKLLRRMNGVVVDKKNVNFPGFILSLELLAFEAIPAFMKKFREKEEVERLGCPRMCKTRFQPCSMKGWPISDLYTELGETKVIDSILRPTEDERELLSELFDAEEEVDLIDDVVDSWTKRLKEGRRVWFRDLCRDDINGRKEVVKHVLESSTPNETENASGSLSVELKELKEYMVETLKGVSERIDGIVERVDDMDGRLQQVESLTVQLSLTLERQPIIVPPAPTMDPSPSHTDNTSEAEKIEKKRKKADKEVIEEVTPEDDGEPSQKEMGEIKEPEKKRKRTEKKRKRTKKTHSSKKKAPYVPRVTRAMKGRDGDDA